MSTQASISITPQRLELLMSIRETLACHDSAEDIRARIFPAVAEVMETDFAASFVWNKATQKSEHGVSINMPDAKLRDYAERLYKCDPHTCKMRAKRRAVLARDVMTEDDLRQTEFYAEFLRPIGMVSGINLFLFDGDTDIGDFRLWRSRDSRPFDASDQAILDSLATALSGAIIRQARAFDGLTGREAEVAQLVARGCRDQDIARVLGISLPTVRSHLNRAMAKRGCANRAELAAAVSRRAS